jgi:sporulation protein YlmC with PRC-barrel domain
MKMELTSLNGLMVYTTRGRYVGRVDDVVLDPGDKRISGLAIGDINKELFGIDAKGVIIPYRWVSAVGDIILMREIELKKKAEEK